MIIPPAPYSYTGEVTTVSVPTLIGSYTYNGESQTPVWIYNENAISIFGQTSGTNAGEYEVTFSLNSKRAYQWSDGTKADKIGTWSIGKAQNAITFNPDSLSLTYYDRNSTVSVSYLGDGELSYSINNDNVTATRSGKIINVTGAKTGNSTVTVDVSEGTNYLATSGTFNVSVDMAKNFTVTVNSYDSDMGSVSGGGTVKEGNSITITATPNTNYKFVSWTVNGEVVSNTASYTFTPTDDIDLTANFVEIPIYTITATIDPEDAGTVTGTGEYREGATCTLVATVADGYTFTGWQENGVTVSESETYSFSATSNRTLTALFEVFSVTFLEYAETSGARCDIDTKISVTFLSSKIVLDVMPISFNSTNQYIFIVPAWMGLYTTNGSSYSFWTGDPSKATTWSKNITNQRTTIEFDGYNKLLKIGNSSYSILSGVTNQSSSWNTLHIPSNYNCPTKLRIYSAKVYVKGELVGDIVPAKNPEDENEIGLYNKITGEFYRNSDRGSFPLIAGPAV